MRSFLSKQQLPVIAGLAIGGAAALYLSRSPVVRAEAPGALDPSKFLPLKVASTKYVSQDTKEVVFSLPEGHSLGGKTAYMTLFKFTGSDGKPVIRPYTPVSEPDQTGSATYVIKAYPTGAMSQHVHKLQPGDTIDVKGPIQKYLLERNQHEKIALIGGGSGITPLFQILEKIANDPEDSTEVRLYYGSNTPQDILLRDEISHLVDKKPKQLSVTHFVGKDAPADWDGEKGFITKEFLTSHLFKSSEKNVKIFVCGPPPLYDAISGNKKSPTDQGELKGALKDLGFSSDQVFKF